MQDKVAVPPREGEIDPGRLPFAKLFQELIEGGVGRGRKGKWEFAEFGRKLNPVGDPTKLHQSPWQWYHGGAIPRSEKFEKIIRIFFEKCPDDPRCAELQIRWKSAYDAVRARRKDRAITSSPIADLSKQVGLDQSPYDGRIGKGDGGEINAIPPPPPHFLGRHQDVAAIVDVLLAPASACAILVQGPPGIGKTSLTHAIGNNPDVIERFGDANRWFVELETATTAVAVQDAIARAVGMDAAQGFKATLATLRQHPGLLVLDNLETPWDPKSERKRTEATLAALADIPGLAILASFRGCDRVNGLAWALVHPVERLQPPFDIELFQRIAQKKFDGDPCLPRFTDALQGIPLAIELVAARAYGRSSLAALWDEWKKIKSDLAEHPDFDKGRLTSLPYSIELSLKSSRMTDDAFLLFGLLGQLPAGLIAQDRDALLGDGGFKAEEALRRIGLAIERSKRLDLLSPIREHAASYYTLAPMDQQAWPAHFLGLTRRLGEMIGRREGEGALTRLRPEFANIVAAFRAVLKPPSRRQDAMAALDGFVRMTYIGSLPTPMLRELANACCSDKDVLGEANCIEGLGDIALARTDHDGARKAYEEALPLYRTAGDVLGEANCIRSLGDIALARTDHDGARKAYEEALPLYRTTGSVLGEANCIRSLGDIALARTDYDGARKAYEEALPLYRTAGDVLGEANCLAKIKLLGQVVD